MLGDGAGGTSPPLRLHHVGFVVGDINASMHAFVASLGAQWDGSVFRDEFQKVSVAFLVTAATDAQIELVEPAGTDSPVAKFLEKGGGLHHVCYEVKDLETALVDFRSRRALIVKRPLPAVAFGGRRIAWVLTAERLLVELLETELRAAAAGKE
jgi:methylmalonyl-CoA/ethylmalonyl-CoA epimerase